MDATSNTNTKRTFRTGPGTWTALLLLSALTFSGQSLAQDWQKPGAAKGNVQVVLSPWMNSAGQPVDAISPASAPMSDSSTAARTAEYAGQPEEKSSIRLTQAVNEMPVPSGNFLSPEEFLPTPGDGMEQITLPDGTPLDFQEQPNLSDPSLLEKSGITRDPVTGNMINRNFSHDSGLGPQHEDSLTADPAPQEMQLTPDNTLTTDSGSGYTGSGYRNTDGSMVGNPYASMNSYPWKNNCAAADFHPGQFAASASADRIRTAPPVAAYGSDGWGCPSTNCCYPFLRLRMALQNTQIYAGVLGYSTPLDISNQGNFGGDLAMNWSTPQRLLLGINAQAGARLTATGKNTLAVGGDTEEDILVSQEKRRTQFFWTTGIFYRDPCSPWQFGAVYDSLNGGYESTYTLGQTRVELSRKFGCKTDLGFRGAFRINDSLVNWWRVAALGQDVQTEVQPVSYYTGFIRRYFDCGGEGMLFAGVTEFEEGLVGGSIEVPISNYFSLKNSFTCVFGNDESLLNSTERTWNVSLGIVCYLGGNSRSALKNPLRPLFDVADNGTFLQTYKH
ncbi:MAG: hypothetical protein Q4G68_05280 [Planctomycetia bacterium]|nr:hypothetical protein [Planctomycetia bacterium]